MGPGRCGVMAGGAVFRTLPTILTVLLVFASAQARHPSFQGLGDLPGGQYWSQGEVALEFGPARNGFG